LSPLTKFEDSTEDSTARAFVTYVTALSRSTKRKPLSDAEENAPGGIRTPDQRLMQAQIQRALPQRHPNRRESLAFKLQRPDGTPADPPTPQAAVPNWRPGDTVTLGAGRSLRVVAVRDDDPDQPSALVVEDVSE